MKKPVKPDPVRGFVRETENPFVCKSCGTWLVHLAGPVPMQLACPACEILIEESPVQGTYRRM